MLIHPNENSQHKDQVSTVAEEHKFEVADWVKFEIGSKTYLGFIYSPTGQQTVDDSRYYWIKVTDAKNKAGTRVYSEIGMGKSIRKSDIKSYNFQFEDDTLSRKQLKQLVNVAIDNGDRSGLLKFQNESIQRKKVKR